MEREAFTEEEYNRFLRSVMEDRECTIEEMQRLTNNVGKDIDKRTVRGIVQKKSNSIMEARQNTVDGKQIFHINRSVSPVRSDPIGESISWSEIKINNRTKAQATLHRVKENIRESEGYLVNQGIRVAEGPKEPEMVPIWQQIKRLYLRYEEILEQIYIIEDGKPANTT